MTAPWDQAKTLQRPSPGEALIGVAWGAKKDGGALYADVM